MDVKIFNDSSNPLPTYATQGSSGVDLYANIKEPMEIKFGEAPVMIPTGIYLEMPSVVEAQVRPRSSMGKRGLIIPNSPGTIDSDYRGEVCVLMASISGNHLVMPGQKIAQIVFAPIIKPDFIQMSGRSSMSETARGEGGFGSTGMNV